MMEHLDGGDGGAVLESLVDVAQATGADGIEQDRYGNYYVSSWSSGTVWKIDSKTELPVVLIDGLESAADFYLEEDKGRLLLPDMKAGIIYTVDINR